MFGIYIHWPFCLSICKYCDFNRKKIDRKQLNNIELIDNFFDSYNKQIDYFVNKIDFNEKYCNNIVTSIYFGGGTPSLMQINLVEKILTKIYNTFNVSKDCEITMETNPTSFEIEKFNSLKQIGINRISIGIQSFNQKELVFLGRKHSVDNAIFAIQNAQEIFNNVTFDLIYALPGQTLQQWEENLKIAMKLNSNHLSLYTLIIEKNTVFYRMIQMNRFQAKDANEMEKFYNFTNKFMKQNDFQQYEISSYAKKGYESRHNLTYWKYFDYIGIGPGASSRLTYKLNNDSMLNIKNKYEIKSIDNTELWLKSEIKNKDKKLKNNQQIQEILLIGLRTIYGINLKDIKTRLNLDLLKYINQKQLNLLIEKKFIKKINKKQLLILNNKGMNILNTIIEKLLS